MSSDKSPSATGKLDRILAEAQRSREEGYRDKALKMYHNHDNNPQDGSNWELLCLYCHDNEHSRYTDQQYFSEGSLSTPKTAQATHNPFADLAARLKKQ